MIIMSSLTSKKEGHRLNGMWTALNKFISKLAHHTLPFYRLLKKNTNVKWTIDCE